MRIAIDARELAGRPTGVGRYLAELLRAWDAIPGALAHEFVLCAASLVALPPLTQLRVTHATAPGRGPWWEQRVLPRLVAQAGADVLFAPAYSGPLFPGAPMVVTIHDVSFAAHPEWFAAREGFRRRLTTRLAARRARRVLTVSDFSKREIVRCCGIDPSKIDVVYSGATRLAATGATAVPPTRPTVLYVGSVFARRHVPELIDGFGRLARRRPDVALEIVGDNRSRPPLDLAALAHTAAPDGRIRVRDYVSDAELATLYRQASAFAFLSEYEGFGLTPLDALAAGVPIVVLDTEVAREIYGPAAIYVSGPDAALVDAALDQALFDASARTRVLEAAPLVLERYSWPESAQRTLQVLLAAAGR
jgi:glycosyltransferase involved in cell wall biosynthesis